MDVTLDYHGGPFGGLELYRNILPRYGDSSLIAYSARVTDTLLKQYDYDFNFLDRHADPVEFSRQLIEKITRLGSRQSCFVAMPFSPQHEVLFATISTALTDVGYKPIRTDQQSFTRSILDEILDSIRKSKFVIFVTTDLNPNVFYECGYAVALGKEVVTITDSFAALPFDIRDRNAISYSGGLDKLLPDLVQRIRGITQVPAI